MQLPQGPAIPAGPFLCADSGRTVLELLTPSQMAEADRAAVDAGIRSVTLMENAGQAVAYEIAQRFPIQPVLVVAGPGNNGGDGFVVARLLLERGWPVRVMSLDAGGPRSVDAAYMARLWPGGLEGPDPEAVAHAG